MKFYDKDNNRLVYFEKKFDKQNFWDEHWSIYKDLIGKFILKSNPKSFICKIVTRFIKPGTGPILEGGCGMGNHVYSLQKIGYEVIGIDNARNTINTIKKLNPEINVSYGDVRRLITETTFLLPTYHLE